VLARDIEAIAYVVAAGIFDPALLAAPRRQEDPPELFKLLDELLSTTLSLKHRKDVLEFRNVKLSWYSKKKVNLNLRKVGTGGLRAALRETSSEAVIKIA
jgi:hypothetical protein